MERKIVTLCGSTRFKREFEEARANEGLAGNIVLTVSCYGHADKLEYDEVTKRGFDELHLDKIRMSHEIFVVNVGGYVGKSTMREIALAVFLNKGIRWLDPVQGEQWLSRHSHDLGKIVAEHLWEEL